jgi:hypothetical protein
MDDHENDSSHAKTKSRHIAKRELTANGDELAVLLRRLLHKRRQLLHLRLYNGKVSASEKSPGSKKTKESRLAPSAQVDPRGLEGEQYYKQEMLTT